MWVLVLKIDYKKADLWLVILKSMETFFVCLFLAEEFLVLLLGWLLLLELLVLVLKVTSADVLSHCQTAAPFQSFCFADTLFLLFDFLQAA